MEFVQGVPWSKLVYSVILIALAAVLLTELVKIWSDNRIYVGKFEFISGEGPQEAASKLFPMQVIGSQNILANQLKAYRSRRTNKTSADETFLLPGSDPLYLPPEALPGMDITYQDINFRQIFTVLRKKFTRPNEVAGIVTQSGGMVQVAVDWPKAPVIGAGETAETRAFLTPPRATAQEAAFQVACSLSWARAASRSEEVAEVPREQFCTWAETVGAYFGLDGKVKNAGGSGEAETKQIRKLIGDLGRLAGEKYVYPEVYRLRADLIDLLPDDARTPDVLAMAQEDRVRYALLKGDVAGKDAGDRRFAALALARPALVITKDGIAGIRENWESLLRPRQQQIMNVSRSTGYIAGKNGQMIGTAFVVAPGLVLTVNVVIRHGDPAAFCLSEDSKCDNRLALGKIVFGDPEGPPGLVLIEIAGHDVTLAAPLPLAATEDGTKWVGRYAYVVGYPRYDARLPPEFLQHLLGGAGGEERVLPGRILAFGQLPDDLSLEGPSPSDQFTTDISTSGGTTGGPLVDLMTGQVIGVQVAGRWQGERGKFAYSRPIPPAVVAAIDARSRPAPAAPVE